MGSNNGVKFNFEETMGSGSISKQSKKQWGQKNNGVRKQWGQVQFPAKTRKQWETMGSGSISSMEPEGPRDYEVIRKLNLTPFLFSFFVSFFVLPPFLEESSDEHSTATETMGSGSISSMEPEGNKRKPKLFWSNGTGHFYERQYS
jgi:hypothetical protein